VADTVNYAGRLNAKTARSLLVPDYIEGVPEPVAEANKKA
jgi:hypothetical protein